MSSSKYSSIQQNHIILYVKPQKKQKHKILQFKQDNNIKETLKKGSRSYHKFSLTDLFSSPNCLEPHKYISHLKELKTIRSLTLDLAPLYSTEIPAKYSEKILSSLKYFKNLSIIHFQLNYTHLYAIQDRNINSLCQALPILNRLPQVRITFSFHISTIVLRPENLRKVFEAFSKLERLTSVSVTFSFFFELEILQAITPLKNSKSLKKFSFNLENTFNCNINQLHTLLTIIKDMKSLKHSVLLFKSAGLPSYLELKITLPLFKEIGQNASLKMTLQKSLRRLTNYQALKFIKSIKDLKPPHKIHVKFTEMVFCSLWCFYLYIFFLVGSIGSLIISVIIRESRGSD